MVESSTLLLGGGVIAGAGLMASLWGRIKSFFQMLTNFVIVEVNVNDLFLQSAILQALHARFRRSRFAPRAFTTGFMFVRTSNKYRHVPFEQLNTMEGMYWNKWKPLFVKSQPPEIWNIEGASRKDEVKSRGPDKKALLSLRFIRGTFKIDDLIMDGVRILNEIDAHRYCIEHIHGSSGDSFGGMDSIGDAARSRMIFQHSHAPIDAAWKDLGPPRRPKPLADMVLNDEANVVVTEIQQWLQSRQWFIDRSMAWRRGYLLYGNPGCGKTSFVRAIAEEFDLPLFVFDLASLLNKELARSWSRANASAPIRIILIEDIDSVFDGRENKAKTDNFQGVTFDQLLNTIDGIEQQDGLLLFITTNEITAVDSAIASADLLSSRPGRVDRTVEFRHPGIEGLRQIAHRIVGDTPAVATLLDKGRCDSPAQFQERCCRKALADYFDEKSKERVDTAQVDRYTDSVTVQATTLEVSP